MKQHFVRDRGPAECHQEENKLDFNLRLGEEVSQRVNNGVLG